MTAAFAVRTIIELVAVLLLIYGLIHEKKLIRFEDRVLGLLARRLRNRRRRAQEAPQVSSVSPAAAVRRPAPQPRHTGEPRQVA